MSKFKKFVLKLFIFLIILLIIIGLGVYKIMFSTNIITKNENTFLYIPSGASIESVVDSLDKNHLFKSKKTFLLTAKIKKYDVLVKSGKYQIDSIESNWHLINKLRSGEQVPVKVVIPSVRKIDKLCRLVAPKLEFSEEDLLNLVYSDTVIEKLGFNENNIPCLFLPNTYEFYWNTSAVEFIERMKKEYTKFWTNERLAKAKKINLSAIDVSILASIVQSEQMQHRAERPIIAGLYLNRLNKNIPLQSDPTVIYAIGDFNIKRVLNYMLKYKSPYNTYLNIGLPPGPILIPEPASVDAVLNAEKNNYLYMCAKEDLSGYHYFSTNLTQHIMYAKRYYNALNKLNIK